MSAMIHAFEQRHAKCAGMLVRTAVIVALAAGPAAPQAAADPAVRKLGAEPRFIANAGQWDEAIDFVAPGRGQQALISGNSLTLRRVDTAQQVTATVRLGFGEVNAGTGARGTAPATGTHHFFLGNDPAGWRTHVPGSTDILIEAVAPGIDVRLYFRQGRLRFDADVAPGATPGALRIHVEGAKVAPPLEDGTLVLATPAGGLRLSAPVSWEIQPDGRMRSVSSAFDVGKDGSIGFAVPDRDPSRPLRIDPALEWASYYGGWTFDSLERACVAGNDDVLVAGWTQSADAPATPGAFDTTFDSGGAPFAGDIILGRFTSSGALLWATLLGGDNSDLVAGVLEGVGGEIIVGGDSNSTNYPVTTGALQGVKTGSSDCTVTGLTATGDALVFSTYLGGSKSEYLYGLALTEAGQIVIAGITGSKDYPTTPTAYQPAPGSLALSDDGFVTVLDDSGSSLVGSTYLGGSSTDQIEAMAVGPDGSVYVSGDTISAGIPVTPGVYNPNPANPFLTRFNPTLTDLIFSTYTFAGSETVSDLAVDQSGEVTLVGYADSGVPLPVTPGAFQPAHAGHFDGFIAKFDALGTQLLACTYLGGGSIDKMRAIHVDSAGAVTVTGDNGGMGFPTTPGAYKTGEIGGDIAVSRLSPDLTQLWYSTGVGGSEGEPLGGGVSEVDVAVNGEGAAIVVTTTDSTDFPMTPGSFDPTYNGGLQDGVVAQLSMLPSGVDKFGASTPGCHGPLALGVMAQPQVGSTAFGLTCTNAEPFACGWLVAGAGALTTPLSAKGAALWVDPNPALLLLPVVANDRGALLLSAPLPNDAALVGLSAFVQAFWTEACGPTPHLAASHGLQLTFVP